MKNFIKFIIFSLALAAILKGLITRIQFSEDGCFIDDYYDTSKYTFSENYLYIGHPSKYDFHIVEYDVTQDLVSYFEQPKDLVKTLTPALITFHMGVIKEMITDVIPGKDLKRQLFFYEYVRQLFTQYNEDPSIRAKLLQFLNDQYKHHSQMLSISPGVKKWAAESKENTQIVAKYQQYLLHLLIHKMPNIYPPELYLRFFVVALLP